MTHTIEAAKKKICFFTIETGSQQTCLAEGCMAWETNVGNMEEGEPGDKGGVPRPDGEGWTWQSFGIATDMNYGRWVRPTKGDRRWGRCIQLDKY
jgi:hypothetical protein